MAFEDAIKEIESHELSARLNVASDARVFLREAQTEESVSVLLHELKLQENRQRLFNRIIRLARRHVDLRYENPWDTALAIYLWLFNKIDSNIAKMAASFVILAQGCWWARMLSHQIFLSQDVENKTGLKMVEITPSSISRQNSDAGETFLFSSIPVRMGVVEFQFASYKKGYVIESTSLKIPSASRETKININTNNDLSMAA